MPHTIDGPPPVPESTSLLSRMMNVFASPGEVFEEVKASPLSTANWLLPTVLLAIVSVASALIIAAQPAIKRQKQAMQEAMFQKMVESGKMPKEAADKAANASNDGGGSGAVLEAAVAPVIVFISLFWSALVVWLGGFVLRGRFSYMRGVEIIGLASMIASLGVVVRTLLVVTTGDMFAGATPGLVIKDFDPMNNLAHGILSVFDVFTLWVMGVKACGLAKFANTTFIKAAIWIFGIWFVLTSGMIVVGFGLRRMMGF